MLSKFDFVTKSGEAKHQELTRITDGKEHPIVASGFDPTGRTAIVVISANGTRSITEKKDGKLVQEAKSSVSSDGKTMTTVIHRPNKPEEIAIFERQ